MAVVALCSAKGSPGVTTTALGLALGWHRPVILVEADVAAGSSILAGWLRGSTAHERGLIDLALAAALGEELDAALAKSLMPLAGPAQLLPGLANATQVSSVGRLWQPLGELLRQMDAQGTDVIIDLGRLGAANGPAELLRFADLTLLTLRADLPAVAGARGWLPVLRNELDRTGQGTAELRAVVIGPGRPYSAREIGDALALPVLGALVWEPDCAAVFSHGAPAPQRRWSRGEKTALPRSLSALRSALVAALAELPTLSQPENA